MKYVLVYNHTHLMCREQLSTARPGAADRRQDTNEAPEWRNILPSVVSACKRRVKHITLWGDTASHRPPGQGMPSVPLHLPQPPVSGAKWKCCHDWRDLWKPSTNSIVGVKILLYNNFILHYSITGNLVKYTGWWSAAQEYLPFVAFLSKWNEHLIVWSQRKIVALQGTVSGPESLQYVCSGWYLSLKQALQFSIPATRVWLGHSVVPLSCWCHTGAFCSNHIGVKGN